MEMLDAIRNRKSTRDFLNEPVPQETIVSILEAAKWCGSFVNCQPWKITVLGGGVMQTWKNILWEQFCLGDKAEREEREYTMGPMPMPEPYAGRGDAFRSNIDNLMFPPGIDHWQERRDAYTKSGIIVRDAPNAILIHMEKGMAESPLHLLAAGGLAQAIALAAGDVGLGSCIMGKPVEGPRLIRKLTGIAESDLILCCIAIGYRNPEGKINQLERTRAGLDELVSWRGF